MLSVQGHRTTLEISRVHINLFCIPEKDNLQFLLPLILIYCQVPRGLDSTWFQVTCSYGTSCLMSNCVIFPSKLHKASFSWTEMPYIRILSHKPVKKYVTHMGTCNERENNKIALAQSLSSFQFGFNWIKKLFGISNLFFSNPDIP